MKKINLLFAVALGVLVFRPVFADEAADIARAATRQSAQSTVISNRQKSTAGETTGPQNVKASRSSDSSYVGNSAANNRAVSPRSNVVSRDTAQDSSQTKPDISERNRATVQIRPQGTSSANSGNVVSRKNAGAARSIVNDAVRRGSPARTAVPTKRSFGNLPRNSGTVSAPRGNRLNRSATTARAATQVDNILGENYKKCRTVFNDCMDEFCVNKDAQLKRCACSSRANEFAKNKEQLSKIEDKLLDFNQRLLTVSMEKEDAAALVKETEGEAAFNQKDSSDSQKLLDTITKKLNANFDNDKFDQSLQAISLSLNADNAFDTVDYLSGASTAAKSGVELYNAALPVCREMALEICSEDELSLAESGYQMLIEQDCNTVAKAYAGKNEQAHQKIREGSALLDMSRLNVYQKRNADDILTCKKKMLDMLTDTTVCGENLGKCLDVSGRYIDPSTGSAFLTVDLKNLENLISRPGPNETWTSAQGNEVFVNFLNSKKKFLEPAMESCQDISDYVWNEFMEDALAQIKLAQENKLEDMRQSCTTLTTECLTGANKSIQDFDSRALSIFGVSADKTVNEMCTGIKDACSALLETTGIPQSDWATGMTDIATDKSYETILQTCREVGRACIIQACRSISGNFGLCENIQTSVNRKSIINRESCWEEVKNCVAGAGEDTIKRIIARLTERGIYNSNFYKDMYGENPEISNGEPSTESNPVYDICNTKCGTNMANSTECYICRISEKIWGNCEYSPTAIMEQHNQIKIPTNSETLLSWFAENTGTKDLLDSCRDTSCPFGFTSFVTDSHVSCVPRESIGVDGLYCQNPNDVFTVVAATTGETQASAITNCCSFSNEPDGKGTWSGNICCRHAYTFGNENDAPTFCVPNECNSENNNPCFNNVLECEYKQQGSSIIINIVCSANNAEIEESSGLITGGQTQSGDDDYGSGKIARCAGEYIIVLSTDSWTYVFNGSSILGSLQLVHTYYPYALPGNACSKIVNGTSDNQNAICEFASNINKDSNPSSITADWDQAVTPENFYYIQAGDSGVKCEGTTTVNMPESGGGPYSLGTTWATTAPASQCTPPVGWKVDFQ